MLMIKVRVEDNPVIPTQIKAIFLLEHSDRGHFDIIPLGTVNAMLIIRIIQRHT